MTRLALAWAPSRLSHAVNIYRRILSTLLQDILHPSHHLLNVLLQVANKLGLSNKKHFSQGKRRREQLLGNGYANTQVARQLH
jgi:hypothetical protein